MFCPGMSQLASCSGSVVQLLPSGSFPALYSGRCSLEPAGLRAAALQRIRTSVPYQWVVVAVTLRPRAALPCEQCASQHTRESGDLAMQLGLTSILHVWTDQVPGTHPYMSPMTSCGCAIAGATGMSAGR